MRVTVNMHQAKTELSKLVKKAWDGDEVIIMRNGKPVAKLSPYSDGKRILGTARGQIWISPDFDDPLPPEIQRYFDGEDDDDDLLGPDEKHAPKLSPDEETAAG